MHAHVERVEVTSIPDMWHAIQQLLLGMTLKKDLIDNAPSHECTSTGKTFRQSGECSETSLWKFPNSQCLVYSEGRTNILLGLPQHPCLLYMSLASPHFILRGPRVKLLSGWPQHNFNLYSSRTSPHVYCISGLGAGLGAGSMGDGAAAAHLRPSPFTQHLFVTWALVCVPVIMQSSFGWHRFPLTVESA